MSLPNTPYLQMPDGFLYELRTVWTEKVDGNLAEKSYLCRITNKDAYLEAFGTVPEDLAPNYVSDDDDDDE